MTTQHTERPPAGVRPRALVTGASSGIGAAFARALAARGQDLVLFAAAMVGGAMIAGADQAGVEQDRIDVAELAAREITIGTLINNAGFGTHGALAELDAAREHDEVLVNVYSLVALTRALLPAMIARRSGGIINVASTAAFQPLPYMATYGSTKAFVLSFGQALAEEVREHGVHVVVLCPGQTETAFFDQIEESRIGRARTADQVVATGLRALERGQTVVIDGFLNAALANSVRFGPRPLVARVAARMQRPSWLRRP